MAEEKKTVDFEVGDGTREFMIDMYKIILEQPDRSGAGYHGPENSRRHGLHEQLSVGLGPTTVNVRFLK